MPIFVVDDGNLYETISDRVKKNSSLENVTQLIDLISQQSDYISNVLEMDLELNSAYSEDKIDNKLVIEHLCSPSDISNRDEFLRLLIALNKLEKYDPFERLDQTIYSLDGYTASSYIQNRFAGVVTFRCISSEVWFDSKMHNICIDLEDSRQVFCKKFFFDNNDYQQAYIHKRVLWPNLYFNDAQTSRFSNLGLDETQHKNLLFRQLNYLDQYGQKHFSEHVLPKDFINIAAAHGVEISPESVKTHGNAKAMRQRKIKVAGNDITCEWHTKLTHDCGRVHVFFNTNAEQLKCTEIGNKLVIGIFVDHLLT